MKNSVKILVVGSVNMDLLMHTKRVPLPGETMISEKYQFSPGGKGANQAVAAAKIGGDTTFVCCIGNDSFGSQLLDSLTLSGVETKYVKKSKSNQSGFAVIMLEEGGNNRIIVHLASNLDLNKNDIDCAFDENYDGMIIQFELQEDIVIYACEEARKRNIPFIVDAGPALDFPLEKIYGMEILSPNETETATLCGITPVTEDDCKKAAEILTKRTNAKNIVLKLGDKGAALYKNGELTFFLAQKITAVDVTAAGDVFTAAMTVEYLKHGDLAKAIEYANRAGALTVTKAGAQSSIPFKKEVDDFYNINR